MARKAAVRYAYEPDYAVPPGATLQETIDSLGMTQRELALRTGMAPKTINEIINGKAPITPATSVLLERVTGVPARMWNNLESNYREQLARTADRERLQGDLDWLDRVPTGELVKRGVITPQPDRPSLLHAVLRFFGVGTVEQWQQLWMQPAGAFRKSPKFAAQPEAVATWLRLGELQAQEIQTQPYDKARFRAALDEIRRLTVEPPERFQARMVELAAAAGVAVVFVPEIRKCPVSGVARWLTPDKALIQLSLRYKTDDQFWFSFFHEAGHVLNDPKKEVYIHDDDDLDGREQAADRFAATFLIPAEHSAELHELTTREAIVEFAQRIGVAPGIVVGRLQKQRLVAWASNLNHLKRRFRWNRA
ncbi:MAG: helix-turn-helix domain-containing protein [Phycisphaerae bacterium]|jgi:HTH-type transcriptional regulator/antitoxin HigA|nr:helix-turn-helix domain-containing protein [Phycisphaerae bacterium]HOO17085.1 helix-turn-helix domain-containing protein [Phycisphaerae bacterium]HPC23446.1 helix-turn-helix domain-containing protein [Phycisphaerae bacterium]HRS29295.1 helix-turn-helix domain-containing protein [Phycisphaerae bacterium]HRT42404.1 helix-turn-helix domain-containing protein [Phycisphaerae bacterium]